MQNKGQIYEMSNGGKFKLSPEVLFKLKEFVQVSSSAKEAGGVLMGRFIKGSKDIIVDELTIPMIGDKRTRLTFKRISPLHQLELEKAWMKSHGTCNYLGEWHTHPEMIPIPSSVDIKDWKRKLRTDTFSSRYLYFVIVGTACIKVWEADRRTQELRQLHIINTES